jgi:hypothetical protein
MECKGAFLYNFVLFCENKSIVSTLEGHGIQEFSGLIPRIPLGLITLRFLYSHKY